MSRPDRNEKHHLHIELTAQQYQLLCRQAQKCGLTKRAFLVRLIEGNLVMARESGLSLSNVIRSCINRTEIRQRQPAEINDLYREINRIGVNINQIARSVNAGIARPEDAKRGLYLLDQVYELMYQVAKK